MRKRPEVKRGDIVRLSKKGKKANYPWPENVTMVVTEVDGDGVDSSSIVHCRAVIHNKVWQIQAYRHHLWFAKKNLFHSRRIVRVLNSNKKR